MAFSKPYGMHWSEFQTYWNSYEIRKIRDGTSIEALINLRRVAIQSLPGFSEIAATVSKELDERIEILKLKQAANLYLNNE